MKYYKNCFQHFLPTPHMSLVYSASHIQFRSILTIILQIDKQLHLIYCIIRTTYVMFLVYLNYMRPLPVEQFRGSHMSISSHTVFIIYSFHHFNSYRTLYNHRVTLVILISQTFFLSLQLSERNSLTTLTSEVV